MERFLFGYMEITFLFSTYSLLEHFVCCILGLVDLSRRWLCLVFYEFYVRYDFRNITGLHSIQNSGSFGCDS